jgi:hypothetical protein
MYLKVHKADMRNHIEVIVALCDKELIGKRLREGEIRLHVNKHFYKGELASKEMVREAFKVATIANIVGKRAVKLAIDEGIIDKNNVIKIQDVPHAQMVVFEE